MLLTPAQIKPRSFESRRTLFILPGVDASHVYVRARAVGDDELMLNVLGCHLTY